MGGWRGQTKGKTRRVTVASTRGYSFAQWPEWNQPPAAQTRLETQSPGDAELSHHLMTFPTSTDVNRPRVLVFLVPGKTSPLVHVNGSDLCLIRAVGSSLATRMVTVWHRGKARVSHLLGKAPSEVQTTHASTRPFPFPYEIVAMIIAHTRDLRTLKACSLACRSWYSAAAPLLHHTLTLTGDMPGTSHVQMGVLSELHELGLVPLVRQIRIVGAWFGPRTLSDLHLRYFSTFANVHTLSLQELDIYLFMPDIRRYFEHFSSTLRSITLSNPHCTPRQLSHFLSIFTNLENIKIPNGCASIPAVTISDTELIPFSPPKLRGWLLLGNFSWVETWTHLITLCGGLRFRYADLHWSGSCTHTLLEACAETLETVRFDTTDSKFYTGSPTD